MIISNKNWQSFSDAAIIENIGSYVKQQRIDHNKTQETLCYEAGINRSTLVHFEMGKQKVSLITLIRILRALNQLNVLDVFETVAKISPIQLAKLAQEPKKRASKKITKNQTPKSDW